MIAARIDSATDWLCRGCSSLFQESLRVERARFRSLPITIRTDQGPEFTGKSLDQWAYQHKVELRLIEAGKPTQKAIVESLIKLLRRHFRFRRSRFTSVDGISRALTESTNALSSKSSRLAVSGSRASSLLQRTTMLSSMIWLPDFAAYCLVTFSNAATSLLVTTVYGIGILSRSQGTVISRY